VLNQYRPLLITILSGIDDILYSFKAPQVIDFIFLSLILFCFWKFFL